MRDKESRRRTRMSGSVNWRQRVVRAMALKSHARCAGTAVGAAREQRQQTTAAAAAAAHIPVLLPPLAPSLLSLSLSVRIPSTHSLHSAGAGHLFFSSLSPSLSLLWSPSDSSSCRQPQRASAPSTVSTCQVSGDQLSVDRQNGVRDRETAREERREERREGGKREFGWRRASRSLVPRFPLSPASLLLSFPSSLLDCPLSRCPVTDAGSRLSRLNRVSRVWSSARATDDAQEEVRSPVQVSGRERRPGDLRDRGQSQQQ